MFKKIAWVLLGLFLIIQFFRPSRTSPVLNPAVDFANVAEPSIEVLSILKNACYNCHSFESKYPWYAQIAPVSWWVANHIEEGREKLNFSEFGNLSRGDRAEVLEEASEEVQEGEMPLSSYTWLGLHPEANLSESQRNLLVQWFNANGGEAVKTENKNGDD
ncbi:MAG: heme-binding domain-containing protein [Saprospiraceae bacterium]|nr:heme-binding domain-containing protein [Saprospiraceae bacterium]